MTVLGNCNIETDFSGWLCHGLDSEETYEIPLTKLLMKGCWEENKMISCTEFIPSYSELFTWLEDNYGREEVDNLWKYLFEPDGKGIPLINQVEKEGLRGCFTYWAVSLNEEAADFSMYVNEKRGFFMIDMHQCPSKGRLLRLKEEIGIVPYHDYCLHCDCYRAAIEKVGLKYIYNFAGTNHASCSVLIYDPKVFDGRVILEGQICQ